MVSHLEVCLPKKPPTPNNIVEGLKVPQRQLWKEYLFVQYENNNNVSLLSDPIPIKSLPEGGEFLCSLIAAIIKEGDCSDIWKILHATGQIGALILKVLILINPAFQWHMLTHS